MPNTTKTKEKEVGVVTHYYDKAGVAVVKLAAALKVGDMIKIRRGEREFEQTVVSMQIDHKQIASAKKGQEVGMKVAEEAREGARIVKLA